MTFDSQEDTEELAKEKLLEWAEKQELNDHSIQPDMTDSHLTQNKPNG